MYGIINMTVTSLQIIPEKPPSGKESGPTGDEGAMEKFRRVMVGTNRLATLDDVDEVVKDLSRLLKRTVKSRWTVVYLFDRERRDFSPARSCGLPERYLPMFERMPLMPDKVPALRTLIKKKQHLVINAGGGGRLLSPPLRRLLRNLTLLAVPMIVRGQVVGAVFIARSVKYPPFSGEEIVLSKDIVSHAALVVSHIKLFDETLDMAVEMAKRIEVILTLDEINKAISSTLSHELVIETALQSIERIMQCELVAIIEEDKRGLTVMTARATSLPVPAALQRGAQVAADSLAGQAYRHGESRYIPSLGTSKRLRPLEKALAHCGIQSLLAIPLVSKDRAKGVLLLGDSQAEQYGRESAFTVEKVAAQLAVALENARLYEETRSLFINTVSSLANAIDAKSPWTKGHSERVMRVSERVALELDLPEPMVEQVRLGGLLHDIGKIGIIEALLERPESLSEEEFPPLRLHPEKGVAILAPIEQLQGVLPGVLHHHERYDGLGYPMGLKGEEIPLAARIIAVADSFDAMVADRPYKKGFTIHEAVCELRRCAGSQFDPLIVERFCGYLLRTVPHGQLAEECA
jgi:HD-GYP domain-containing protein (c-di-GMP phosphodiesterase class II)